MKNAKLATFLKFTLHSLRSELAVEGADMAVVKMLRYEGHSFEIFHEYPFLKKRIKLFTQVKLLRAG